MKWELNESKYASGPVQTSSILKALHMEDEKRPRETGSLNESMQLSGTSKLNGRRNLRRGKENPDNIKTAGNKTKLTGDYDLRESQRYQRETGKKYPVKKGMNQMDVVRDNRDLGGFGYKGDYEYDHPKGLNRTDGSDQLAHYAKERERFTNAKKNAMFATQAANIKASDDAPSYIKNDPRNFEADAMKFFKQARNILNNRRAHKPYEVNKTEYNESLLTESTNEVEGLNAFITNLGKYNEGELVGEWAHFPMDEDDFEQLLQKIGIDGREYEEWFVTDYDSEFDAYDMLGEYPSFEQLNEVGEMVEDVDMEALSLITDMGYSMEEAIEGLENGDFIIVNDPHIWRFDKDEQIGLAYIYDVLGDDSQCIEMMKNDSNYIDEESYGRDIRLGGDLDYYAEEEPEFYEELENMSDRELGQYFIDEFGAEGISKSYFDFAYFGRNFSASGEAYCDGNNVVFMFR